MTANKPYRVTVKVRNNNILSAIEDSGGEAGAKWCSANGLVYQSVNDLINMTTGPLKENGQLRKVAADLCDVLGKLPDELWTNEQLYPLEKNFSEMNMDLSQVISLLPNDQQSYLPDFSELENGKIKQLVITALGCLTDRERKVVTRTFAHDMTLDDIAEKIGVTRERVRQILAKSLKKLRHPSISSKLIDCLSD